MLAGGQGLFVGRREVLGRLVQVLEQTRAGTPRLVLVNGPGGIGKTTLVQRFLAESGVGFVLRASGDEDETSLEFGLLTQLFTGARAYQAEPVGWDEGGFGGRGRFVDPLVAGAALVDLLGQLQRSGPVALFVDDAQWADRPSLQALTFALRRLRVDRVLTVVVTRDAVDPRLPDGLRRMLTSENTVLVALEGLGVDELRNLSARLGSRSLSHRAAARLRAHTDGSPLHARALLEQVSAAAFDDPEVPLPAPRSFATLVRARLAACEPDVERLVAAASVLGMHTALDLAAAVAEVDDPLAGLERAIAAGLLEERLGERGLSFPHPLVHAAVYRHLGPARRAALHLRAAGHAADEAVRLRHRARAATGPDATLSEDLARLGRREAISRAWGSAADHLSAAAGLAPNPRDRERFTLEAVECRLLAGDVDDPAALSARLRAFAPSGWRSYVLAQLVMLVGSPDDCEALLRDAWQRCDPDVDPVLGARIAGQFAGLYGVQMRSAEQIEWADLALRLAPDQTATDMIRYIRMDGRAMSGRAADTLPSLAGLPEPAVASAAELEELLGRGALRLCADDLDGALRDLGGVLAASHDRSATFRWVAAVQLAVVEFRAGRWDDALVHAELGLSIAADADQDRLDRAGHQIAALVHAARGEWPAAEVHARVLRTAATTGHPNLVVSAALVQAQLARARGQPEAIVTSLEPLLSPEFRHVVENPGVAWWIGPLFEALVVSGELERAESVLGSYEELAAERAHSAALAVAGGARATLAAARGDDAEARRCFDRALVHAGRVNAPFERALLRFAYGKFLRRAGKRACAGTQLYAARDTFSRLGARPDLERCERELAACGLTTGPRRQRDAARLTPQELAVARLVAGGLTNRQVARELVISVKTVEYHLGHVYAKLEVRSRSQLVARLIRD